MPKKMLILRGNHGWREDEKGKQHNYTDGALHEPAAKEYARRTHYEAVVLPMSGDPPKKGKRDHSPQTERALVVLRKDSEIRALYGFSGGGHNVFWILKALSPEERDQIDLVTVVGADETPKSAYDKSRLKALTTQSR